MASAWKLKLGNEVLGTLTQVDTFGTDQLWILCQFESSPAFRSYAPLFAEEAKLMNMNELGLCRKITEKIASLGLTLVPENQGTESTTNFILHIDGNKGWFHIYTT
jgi:hypothetical protein